MWNFQYFSKRKIQNGHEFCTDEQTDGWTGWSLCIPTKLYLCVWEGGGEGEVIKSKKWCILISWNNPCFLHILLVNDRTTCNYIFQIEENVYHSSAKSKYTRLLVWPQNEPNGRFSINFAGTIKLVICLTWSKIKRVLLL